MNFKSFATALGLAIALALSSATAVFADSAGDKRCTSGAAWPNCAFNIPAASPGSGYKPSYAEVQNGPCHGLSGVVKDQCNERYNGGSSSGGAGGGSGSGSGSR